MLRKGNEAVVRIGDDGKGISDRDKKNIFDMFYTAGGNKGDSRRGLGLGLALCKIIVEAHGGRIAVMDNSPVRGTVFEFTLPIAEVINIVEDDQAIRNFMTATLDLNAYRCIAAESGEQALMYAVTNRPDIIILDLGLPDMDGTVWILLKSCVAGRSARSLSSARAARIRTRSVRLTQARMIT